MKIHSISLENFLCYHGPNNKFEFIDGLNLILGPNGYGKSKLYDAFQWVFKDGITDELNPGVIKPTERLKKNLLSDKALTEAQIGEKVKCEVVIDLSNTSGNIFRLKRKYYVERKSSEEWLEQLHSTLEVYKKDAINFRPLNKDSIIEFLENIIPAEIMPYVWFQGEHGINKTIDISNAHSLRTVIQQFSDINTWEKYIEIAEKVAATVKREYDQIVKTSQRNRKEKDELLEKQEYCHSQLVTVKERLSEAKKNLQAAQDKVDSVIDKISTSQKIKELNTDLEKTKKELDNAISMSDSIYMDFTKNLFKKYWILMGTEKYVDLFEQKYKRFNDYISEKKAAIAIEGNSTNSLPRGVPERMYVQSMLDKEHCFVCNRPALKGTKEYEAIEKLLPRQVPSLNVYNDIETDLRKLWNHSFSLSDKFKNTEEQVAELLKKREDLSEQKKEFEISIKNLSDRISNEIANSGIDQATDIIAMYDTAIQDIQTYNYKIGELEGEKKRLDANLNTIKLKLHRLTVDEINPILEKKLELTEDLKELTIRIKDSQYQELITLLEKTANEHYEKINKPTGAFYGKIKFHETPNGGFIPAIVDDNGARINNLNTSQTTSLKLAIIMAIVTTNKNRGYAEKYPLISDAPISDFDSIKSKLFLVEVANTYSQSIIIVKDYLMEDYTRKKRYTLDAERLHELKDLIEKNGNKLSIFQLDIPDDISIINREKLKIIINSIGDLCTN